MIFAVLDSEANGLLNTVTKIYCLCYTIVDESGKEYESNSLTDYEEIRRFLKNEDGKIDCFVAHNLIGYDKPLFKKILDVDINGLLIDSMGLAYYLDPTSKKHGLKFYGENLEIEKPEIEDWETGSIEEYIFRCEEDVKINTKLFLIFIQYLIELYGSLESSFNIINYLNFKLECLAEQAEIGLYIDIEKVKNYSKILDKEFKEKTTLLASVMPVENAKILKKKPASMVKKDGTPSSHGLKWIQYLVDNGLPLDTEVHREPCNPGSDPQLKKWLFSLGWKPREFKVSKNTGQKIPQVSLKFGAGLCPSVKELYEVEPNLEILDGYFKTRHRLGIFKSYIKSYDEVNGQVYSRANKFTKTLRLAHAKPIANLPSPKVYFGKEIREVLVSPGSDFLVCGSDVSSLEDSTKQHYIYYYDPEYVKEMRVPGFDPHIDIGILAGIIREEDSQIFKKIDSTEDKSIFTEDEMTIYKKVKKDRGTAKTTNFSATYGAGGPKIAEAAGLPVSEGNKLHKIYWKRNWAVKKIAEDCTVKVLHGQKWLYNPLSGFWLFLSAEKDRFSALNQNTGKHLCPFI